MQVKWGTSMFHTNTHACSRPQGHWRYSRKDLDFANLFQMNKCACSHPSSKLTEVVPGLWSPFLPFCPCVSLDIRPGWGIWAWTTYQVLSLTWTCFSEQWRLSLCPDGSQRLMGVKNFISDYKSRNCFCIWYKNDTVLVSNIEDTLPVKIEKTTAFLPWSLEN